jgi:hypothetical protein
VYLIAFLVNIAVSISPRCSLAAHRAELHYRTPLYYSAKRCQDEGNTNMLRQKGQSQTATLPAIRMYPHELQSIQKRAIDAGLKLSEYVRATLAEPIIPDSPTPLIQHIPAPTPLPSTSHHSHLSIEQDSPLSSPKTESSQFSNSNEAKPLHAPTFVNATVARKMGHESGCKCMHCERIRSVLSTSKPPHRIDKRKR